MANDQHKESKMDTIKDDTIQKDDAVTNASHHITNDSKGVALEANEETQEHLNQSSTSEQSPQTSQLQPQPLRQNMVSLATSFLNSPNVRSSTREKQVAFLKNKGLTKEEIDAAYEKAEGQTAIPSSSSQVLRTNSIQSSSPSSSSPNPSPSIPSPPIPQKPHLPIQQQIKPSLSNNDDIVKKIRYIVLIAGGFTGAVILIIRVFITPLIDNLYKARSELHSHQLDLVKKLKQNLDKFNSISLKPSKRQDLSKRENLSKREESSSNEPTPATVEIHTPPNTFLSPLQASLSRLRDLSKQAKIKPSTEEFSHSLSELTSYLTTESYFRPSYNYGVSDYSYYVNPEKDKEKKETDLAEGCRNEIRSLKGMLLARRTFPNPVR